MQTSAIGELTALTSSPSTSPVPSLANSPGGELPKPAALLSLTGFNASPLTLEALLALQLQNTGNSNFWDRIESLMKISGSGLPLSATAADLYEALISLTSPGTTSISSTQISSIRGSSVFSLEQIGSLAFEEELLSLSRSGLPTFSALAYGAAESLFSPIREKAVEALDALRVRPAIQGSDSTNPAVAILPGANTPAPGESRRADTQSRFEHLAPRPFRYEKEDPGKRRQSTRTGNPVLQRFLRLIRNFAQVLSRK